MIVSRGLGNSIIPVRLFNYPEVVCVELDVKTNDLWRNNMPKLLVIEDDREINHLICEYMAETGQR